MITSQKQVFHLNGYYIIDGEKGQYPTRQDAEVAAKKAAMEQAAARLGAVYPNSSNLRKEDK